MKRIATICLLMGVGGTALFLLWPDLKIGLHLDDAEPFSVRATASERVVAAGGGQPTEADRAHAADRARWKAYYYAQLRAAELRGPSDVNSRTQITNMNLGEQTLESSVNREIRAMPLNEDAVTLEFDGDVVRAHVALDVSDPKGSGRRKGLLAVLRDVRAGSGAPHRGGAVTTSGREQDAASPPGRGAVVLANRDETIRPMSSISTNGPARNSGYIIVLPRSGPMVGVFPVFYDSRGTLLGSAHDLAPERRLAGLPLLGSDGSSKASRWVGSRPSRHQGTVSQGDVFLRTSFSADETTAFREALQQDRVVMILDEEA